MKRRAAILLLACVFLGNSIGCTPQEYSVWSIIQIFGGGDIHNPLAQKAVSVAQCESRLDPNVKSADGPYYGLFQINLDLHYWRFSSVGAPGGFWEWNNAWWNTMVAKQIYDEVGWAAWPTCGR